MLAQAKDISSTESAESCRLTSLPMSASKWIANHFASLCGQRSQQPFVKRGFIGPKTKTGANQTNRLRQKPSRWRMIKAALADDLSLLSGECKTDVLYTLILSSMVSSEYACEVSINGSSQWFGTCSSNMTAFNETLEDTKHGNWRGNCTLA